MRSLVVYESWFGNTRRIAEEIADALAREGQVDLVSVDEPLPPLEEVDLLVVGAPTHVHGLSSKRSREGALDQGAPGEPGIGVRDWIDALPDGAVDDQAGEHEQRGAVRLRGEDLRAAQPERPVPARRLGGEAQHDERHRERAGVREHVRRVGEERERVREDAGHDLADHEGDDQRERKGEATCVLAASVRVTVLVHVSIITPGSAPRSQVPSPRHGSRLLDSCA